MPLVIGWEFSHTARKTAVPDTYYSVFGVHYTSPSAVIDVY